MTLKLGTWSVPALTIVLEVYVLGVFRQSVPFPILVNPVPEIVSLMIPVNPFVSRKLVVEAPVKMIELALVLVSGLLADHWSFVPLMFNSLVPITSKLGTWSVPALIIVDPV